MSDQNKNEPVADGKLKLKEYERELARLHVEFVKLQQWVVHKGLKVCILFEGRDGAVDQKKSSQEGGILVHLKHVSHKALGWFDERSNLRCQE